MTSSANTRFAVAVHVLTYLVAIATSDDPRPVSSDELSASANVNPVHIRRVMGPLRRAGLVHSRPGVHGGWELAAPADTRLDVVWELVHGDDAVMAVHGPSPQCPVGRGVKATLDTVEQQLAAAVRAQLASMTIADVVRMANEAESGAGHEACSSAAQH